MAPTGRKIQFETVDVMRVRNGKITEHWGVANLFSLMQQLGAWPAKQDRAIGSRPANQVSSGGRRGPVGTDPLWRRRAVPRESISSIKNETPSLRADGIPKERG